MTMSFMIKVFYSQEMETFNWNFCLIQKLDRKSSTHSVHLKVSSSGQLENVCNLKSILFCKNETIMRLLWNK